jgi:hypothetical protein
MKHSLTEHSARSTVLSSDSKCSAPQIEDTCILRIHMLTNMTKAVSKVINVTYISISLVSDLSIYALSNPFLQ